MNVLLRAFPAKRIWLNMPVRWKVLVPLLVTGLLMGLIGLVTVLLVTRRQARDAALETAAVVAAQVHEVRRAAAPVESAEAPHAVVHDFVAAAGERTGYQVRLLGLESAAATDDFQRAAQMAALAGGRPHWAVETQGGQPVLRYAMAESRQEARCQRCHDGAAGARGARAIGGLIEVTMPLGETVAADRAAAARVAIPVGIVFIALGAWLAAAMRHSLARPLERLVDLSQAVAEGDLTKRLRVVSSDEIGQLRAALNRMLEELEQAVAAVIGTGDVLVGSSEQLAVAARSMSASADQSAHEVDQVSGAADRVSGNVGAVAEASQEMNASIRDIARSAGEASEVAGEAVEMVRRTGASMSRLGQSRAEIGRVVEVIGAIAEQTNLLALNATIEAARAGEMGKGFAVVAGEVKQLARQTADATREIGERITSIQHDASEVVDVIGDIGSIVTRIHDLQNSIAAAVEEQTASTAEIDRSARDAATGSEEIASRLARVADEVRKTSREAGASAQTTLALAAQAAELRRLLARFTVDGDGPPSSGSG